MSRLRALLAVLLTLTWCSAAWHVNLEAVGVILEHEHHAHDRCDSDHAPLGADDGHEEVFARDVTKDQVRAIPANVAWFLLAAFATWLIAAVRPSVAALTPLRIRRETDPPLAQVWQFVQRCAPESAAPPALG